MKPIQKIGLIGSGNVAHALGQAWANKGVEIVACYNRKQERLAWNENLQPLESAGEMPHTLDAILVATSDSAVFEIIELLPPGPIIIHFSGALPLPKRPGASIWPIQSVRKEKHHESSSYPLVLNATDPTTERLLIPFVKKIAKEYHCLSTHERQSAHLAAVFASNFSNHSLSIAQALSAESGIPWSTFEPIVTTIAQEGALGNSFSQQTGPALRRETNVIQSHRKALGSNPRWLDLYDAMTSSIQDMHTLSSENDNSNEPKP